MLYVIGPIFKEEFKETKTVALGRRREELQGLPRRGHVKQGDLVRKFKKSWEMCFFMLVWLEYDFSYNFGYIYHNHDQYQPD